MAEEHRCQALEGYRLCANSCGFFCSPATMNLCSKCYRDFCLKEQQEASIKSIVEASVSQSVSSSSSSSLVIDFRSLPLPPLLTLPGVAEAEDVPAS
ncbi:PREDICTED: zinc finger A20 and AN1 domain-containing stress-associated protein 4-like [Fragaria vesca subsp. vesca]